MGSSWKESSEEYKNNKKKIIDGYEKTPHKKIKKKKKTKRSNHKHEYIPAIYNVIYKQIDGTEVPRQMCGQHCKICGRVENMYFLWYNTEDMLKKFKKNNPEWIELTLPREWDYFKDKNIPI